MILDKRIPLILASMGYVRVPTPADPDDRAWHRLDGHMVYRSYDGCWSVYDEMAEVYAPPQMIGRDADLLRMLLR